MRVIDKSLVVSNSGSGDWHDAIISDDIKNLIEEYLCANLTVDTIDNLTDTFKLIAKSVECDWSVAGFVALRVLSENILKFASD